MICVVTGAAGFVGSHLCEYLLRQGDDVIGIDCFTDYYDVAIKNSNVNRLRGRDGFRFRTADLTRDPLGGYLEEADVVYHLAGQPGVRASWGKDFTCYVDRNIMATQRLLEECRDRPLSKFVYASSSSVYGDAEECPTSETLCPRPVSPYGVTKLAAEHLCGLYRSAFGIPTVSLRLFTAYGPGQRPDMAFARLVRAALRSEPFPLYGDGLQSRDFTYVGDVVRAMRDAALCSWTGVANIGGGTQTSMKEVIDIVSELAGVTDVVQLPSATGDVRHTSADISVARAAFGYRPTVDLRVGLQYMVDAARLLAEPPLAQVV